MPPLRILSQLGDADDLDLPADLRSQVEVVAVPPSEPIPERLTGDVLLMTFGNDAFYELAERQVKWLHYTGTGLDRLDVRRLARGRSLTNSRGVVAVPISEWVVGAMLHHEKQFAEVFIRNQPAKWPVRTPLGTLHGRRVALLGLGAIGSAVAERLKPFGADLRALRHSSRPSSVAGVELVEDFSELLSGAEHLVLAAPLTAKTHHILNAQSLKSAKPGLHVVNVARGDLIDQDALKVALDDGTVAAASLDTVTPEPLPQGHWLYEHPKVRLSPHISWSWPRARETLLGTFVTNLRRYLAGEPLENVVDPEQGY